MPDRRGHARVSKQILGDLSLGEGFQAKFDEHSGILGPYHREVDHTWKRVRELSKLYGEIGRAEILIHLALDYGLVPSWTPLLSSKRNIR